jgi:hypothetical protein
MTGLKYDPLREYHNSGPYPLLYLRRHDGALDPRLLERKRPDLDPSTFDPCRRSPGFRGRRPYSGTYPFGPGRQIVPFESLTELRCLMELDQGGQVRQIAAQPFGLLFPGSLRHYPDFAARLHDGRIVVIDVRPAKFSTEDDFVRHAVMTSDVCGAQGWEYRVMHGCTGWIADNLEWMCAFRHPECVPDAERERAALDYLAEPRTMAEAAAFMDHRPELGLGYAFLSNMMFRRKVVTVDEGPFYPGLAVVAAAGEEPD